MNTLIGAVCGLIILFSGFALKIGDKAMIFAFVCWFVGVVVGYYVGMRALG